MRSARGRPPPRGRRPGGRSRRRLDGPGGSVPLFREGDLVPRSIRIHADGSAVVGGWACHGGELPAGCGRVLRRRDRPSKAARLCAGERRDGCRHERKNNAARAREPSHHPSFQCQCCPSAHRRRIPDNRITSLRRPPAARGLLAVAVLVLLPRTARARLVAADLALTAPFGARSRSPLTSDASRSG